MENFSCEAAGFAGSCELHLVRLQAMHVRINHSGSLWSASYEKLPAAQQLMAASQEVSIDAALVSVFS